jgi:hypothetical protein
VQSSFVLTRYSRHYIQRTAALNVGNAFHTYADDRTGKLLHTVPQAIAFARICKIAITVYNTIYVILEQHLFPQYMHESKERLKQLTHTHTATSSTGQVDGYTPNCFEI